VEIAEYIRERDPSAALRVRAAIYRSLQNLIAHPYLGRVQKTEGVRKLVIRRYPYLVYYIVNRSEDEVIVLNVKHAAQEREHEDT